MRNKPSLGSYSTREVANRCFMTVRQVQHWTRKGWIRASVLDVDGGKDSKGSWGHTYSEDDLAHCRKMAILVRIGFTHPQAARLAKSDTPVIKLGYGMHLVDTRRVDVRYLPNTSANRSFWSDVKSHQAADEDNLRDVRSTHDDNERTTHNAP